MCTTISLSCCLYRIGVQAAFLISIAIAPTATVTVKLASMAMTNIFANRVTQIVILATIHPPTAQAASLPMKLYMGMSAHAINRPFNSIILTALFLASLAGVT